ncbi:hypothetical protein AK812_SmicGene26387 [Symbiodinium microadriaticum]|uniref:Uncharacterized protein n=1 Tax=Symbiodinium microadriaticum TaxID=2951 RepID=A0A1Q9D9J1_SYMMI|nr:hypothetical protein AK812_SmicGene26387 [Symbiodinium microadriaticum]
MPSAAELDRSFQESLRVENVLRQMPPSDAGEKMKLAMSCRSSRHGRQGQARQESPDLQARQRLARTRFFLPARRSPSGAPEFKSLLDGETALQPNSCAGELHSGVEPAAPSHGVGVFADLAAARRVRGRSARSRAALMDTVFEAYGVGDDQIINVPETKLRFAKVFVGEEVRRAGPGPWRSPVAAPASWTPANESIQIDLMKKQRIVSERHGRYAELLGAARSSRRLNAEVP